MSLENLGRRLKREVARSPKKAGILGLIFLVALYFWVPLIGSWVGGDEQESAADAAPAPTAGSPALSPAAQASGTASATIRTALDWNDVAQWIEHDPLMKPALPAATGNPFAVRSELQPLVNADDRDDGTAGPQRTLRLTATFLVGRTRLATINGATYRLRDPVHVAGPGENQGEIIYHVVEIRPRTVVLSRNGERYELELPRSHLNPGDRIRGG